MTDPNGGEMMKCFAFQGSVILAVLAGWVSAQVSVWRTDGAAGDRVGSAVAGVGDVNSDGVPDFAVGAIDVDNGGFSNVGRVTVYSGYNRNVLWSVYGTNPGDRVGEGIAGGKDLNSDGVPDVLVISTSLGISAGNRTGGWWVYSGTNGSLISSGVGPVTSVWFGYASALIDDVNGDAVPDVIIGSPELNAVLAGGAVYCYSGANGNLLWTVPGAGRWAWDVDGAGDWNLDGIEDVLVGCYCGVFGVVNQPKVLSGANGTVLFTFTPTVAGNVDYGFSVQAMPDANNDGIPEAVISSIRQLVGAQSRVEMFWGGTGNLRWSIDVSGWSNYGAEVSRCGDVDFDGETDLITGTGYPLGNRGMVTWHSGATGEILRYVLGPWGGEYYGSKLAHIGDVDLDGVGDSIVGVFSGGLSNAGYATILSGAPVPSSLASTVYYGPLGGCGATGIPPILSLDSPGLPRLGAPLTLRLAGGTPFTSGTLGVELSAPTRWTYLGCPIFLPLNQWFPVPFQTNGTGAWILGFTVPNDPALIGSLITAQAVVNGPGGPLFSNGVFLVTGQ